MGITVESLHCIFETKITLYINHTLIKNFLMNMENMTMITIRSWIWDHKISRKMIGFSFNWMEAKTIGDNNDRKMRKEEKEKEQKGRRKRNNKLETTFYHVPYSMANIINIASSSTPHSNLIFINFILNMKKVSDLKNNFQSQKDGIRTFISLSPKTNS